MTFRDGINGEIVPCKSVAEHLGLRIHQRETFRGWKVSSTSMALIPYASVDISVHGHSRLEDSFSLGKG